MPSDLFREAPLVQEVDFFPPPRALFPYVGVGPRPPTNMLYIYIRNML
jgi:hypothetical protein